MLNSFFGANLVLQKGEWITSMTQENDDEKTKGRSREEVGCFYGKGTARFNTTVCIIDLLGKRALLRYILEQKRFYVLKCAFMYFTKTGGDTPFFRGQ